MENSPQIGRFAKKLYDVLLPEAARAVAMVDDWAALGTLAGPVRAENQDRMVAGHFTSRDSQSFRMVALSDGMGGLAHGQAAAALTLSSFLWCLTSSNGDIEGRIDKAARYANEVVFKEWNGKSGATLSAIIITERGAVIGVNVGDSRIYAFDEASRRLGQLSVDDTLAGLADQGFAVDARHNATALLQHVGMGDGFEPNLIFPETMTDHKYIILSTDGIHWVGNKLLELISQNATDHVQLARRLIQLAEMAGAHDNATVGVLSPKRWSTAGAMPYTETVDVELWTPQAKTVLILERGFQTSTDRSDVGTTRPDSSVGNAPLPVKPPKKRTKRKPRQKPKPAEYLADEAPIERPELTFEFGRPKREADETSR